jgi:hypothetical protein
MRTNADLAGNDYIERSAYVSSCGRYRYSLMRRWSPGPDLLWVMLNPSTADGTEDDATIRRCINFSRSWGYGSMTIGNLYAIRSTDPAILYNISAEEARGPENEAILQALALDAGAVVCAWGAMGGIVVPDVLRGCPGGVWHLGLTKHGCPRHPLYAPGKSQLQRLI